VLVLRGSIKMLNLAFLRNLKFNSEYIKGCLRALKCGAVRECASFNKKRKST